MQLAPDSPAGRAVGTEIAKAHPAPVGTARRRAKVCRSIDDAAAASGRDDVWRRSRSPWYGRRLWSLFTGIAVRFVDEARKRFGLSGTFARWAVGPGCRLASCGPIGAPTIQRKDHAEPKKHEKHPLIDKQVSSHREVPLTQVLKGLFYRVGDWMEFPARSRDTTALLQRRVIQRHKRVGLLAIAPHVPDPRERQVRTSDEVAVLRRLCEGEFALVFGLGAVHVVRDGH